MVTLILGGARSGKSSFAQARAAQADNVIYLATAEASDEEMRIKIERHRKDRPAGWKTVETPLDLDTAVKQYGNNNTVLLIDCLTTFTANLMMAEAGNKDAIFRRMERVREALRETLATVLLISNEVGLGVVPAYPSGHQFRDLLGEINQKFARISHNVIFMIAGLPLVLKGTLEP